MLNKDLKENIKGYSHFVYYRDKALWYRTATGMVFPVPVADIKDTTFLPMEKSLLLMRWIRKYLDGVT
jgi:hypothetical protein